MVFADDVHAELQGGDVLRVVHDALRVVGREEFAAELPHNRIHVGFLKREHEPVLVGLAVRGGMPHLLQSVQKLFAVGWHKRFAVCVDKSGVAEHFAVVIHSENVDIERQGVVFAAELHGVPDIRVNVGRVYALRPGDKVVVGAGESGALKAFHSAGMHDVEFGRTSA